MVVLTQRGVGSTSSASANVARRDAVTCDTTEQQDTAHWLRLQGAALDAAANAIVITDRDGRIIWVNAAFTRLTGYSASEAVGQEPRILRSGHHDDAFYKEMWRTILDGRVWQGELVNQRKDGSLYTEEQTITPVRDQQGRINHFIAIKQDITDRKHAEDEVRRLNVELEQRVRQRTAQLEASNRELETFSYSVSHDLRAPLRAIDGFSKSLLLDYDGQLDAQGRHYLERVRAATERMGQLISDLLALSRVTRGELRWESVALSELAQTIATELQKTQAERHITFVITPGIRVEGDARLLRVALDNLLGNAWKYTGKHSQARIEFGTTEQDGHPVYFVRDDGAGFDAAYAGKLFGPFQRLHAVSEFEGTGIGLATVQRIIHRHGGRIWADGAVERGATFYFTLGAHQPDATTVAPAPGAALG